LLSRTRIVSVTVVKKRGAGEDGPLTESRRGGFGADLMLRSMTVGRHLDTHLVLIWSVSLSRLNA